MKHSLLACSIILGFTLTLGLSGQTSSIFDDVVYNASMSEGSIKIVQDDAIKTLVEKHQWAKSKQKTIVGYRIRIFSNSGPTAKVGYDRTMARFAYSYDYIPIYPKFVYPNYKIYVGDFRTESEALKFRKQIEHQFTGAFLVKTKINYPKLESND
ncbi:MAG TPA: hypothetical protein DDX98_14955 [Bacteroidales bacterium]|nr:hypothetical protein [Bacteroidales bacterium]